MKTRIQFIVALVLVVILTMGVIQSEAAVTTTKSTYGGWYSMKQTGTWATGTTTTNITCAAAGACTAGTYEVMADVGITAATGSGSATVTITVNDGVSSKTLGLSAIDMATTTAHATSLGLFDLGAAATFTSGVVVASATNSSTMFTNVVVRRVK